MISYEEAFEGFNELIRGGRRQDTFQRIGELIFSGTWKIPFRTHPGRQNIKWQSLEAVDAWVEFFRNVDVPGPPEPPDENNEDVWNRFLTEDYWRYLIAAVHHVMRIIQAPPSSPAQQKKQLLDAADSLERTRETLSALPEPARRRVDADSNDLLARLSKDEERARTIAERITVADEGSRPGGRQDLAKDITAGYAFEFFRIFALREPSRDEQAEMARLLFKLATGKAPPTTMEWQCRAYVEKWLEPSPTRQRRGA